MFFLCLMDFNHLPPPLTPPRKGEGDTATPATPSPLRGGVRGGGNTASNSAAEI